MPYTLTTFGAVNLPSSIMSTSDMSTATISSTIRSSVGSSYDWRGSGRQWPTMQVFVVKGLYLGSSVADLKSQIDALRGLIGVRDTLNRRDISASVNQTRIARLINVNVTQTTEQNAAVVAEVEATFESATRGWRAATATTATASGASGTININPGGNIDVSDAIITVQGAVTTVTFTSVTLGVALSWSGGAGSGQSLVFDCGNQTVFRGTSAVYPTAAAGIYGANHTARGWLPLLPNTTNSISFTASISTPISISAFGLFA